MNYSELLNKPYKKEMLSNIQKDLKKYYPTMEEKEAKLLANEIYSACISICYRVNFKKLLQLLCSIDNCYYNINEKEQDGIVDSAISDDTTIYLREIVTKYTKEVQRRERYDRK